MNNPNTYEVTNPSNGEKLCDVPISDNQELELAVQSAAKAQKNLGKKIFEPEGRRSFKALF
ncbi:aldehyde dehydrogenase [Candidatus Pelagibacter sp. IMCC9063]|nr:aldehyde dehydrogenase [Candidatus Pelagibacter sp. IMCC9063]